MNAAKRILPVFPERENQSVKWPIQITGINHTTVSQFVYRALNWEVTPLVVKKNVHYSAQIFGSATQPLNSDTNSPLFVFRIML